MSYACLSYTLSRLLSKSLLVSCVLGMWMCLSCLVVAQQTSPYLYKEAGVPFFQNFTAKSYEGHQQNWTMLQDDRGVVYIGNLPGILEYDGVRWRSIPLPNASVVRSLAKDSTGTIYVGAHAEFGYLSPDSRWNDAVSFFAGTCTR